jgi:hypothetical protein
MTVEFEKRCETLRERVDSVIKRSEARTAESVKRLRAAEAAVRRGDDAILRITDAIASWRWKSRG